jgi:hypothetical protein
MHAFVSQEKVEPLQEAAEAMEEADMEKDEEVEAKESSESEALEAMEEKMLVKAKKVGRAADFAQPFNHSSSYLPFPFLESEGRARQQGRERAAAEEGAPGLRC